MTRERAIEILIDMASRYGENFEEDFSRRVLASDTDEQCKAVAAASEYEVEAVLEIRDLWRAIDLLGKEPRP